MEIGALKNVKTQGLVIRADRGQIQPAVKASIIPVQKRVHPGDESSRIGNPSQEEPSRSDELLEDRKNAIGTFEMFDEAERKNGIKGRAVLPGPFRRSAFRSEP